MLDEWQTVDPDQTPRYAASDLDLHYLPKPLCPNTWVYYGNFFLRNRHLVERTKDLNEIVKR